MAKVATQDKCNEATKAMDQHKILTMFHANNLNCKLILSKTHLWIRVKCTKEKWIFGSIPKMISIEQAAGNYKLMNIIN